jgi:Predicted glycosyltransferases
MNVAVIIISYNFERWMDKCLGSLRKSSIPLEIIVVDNLSRDNTTTLIEKNYPEVHLLKNQTNAGFGKANNQAMAYAIQHGCDYFFLLNQDAWVDSNTIEKLLDLSLKNPQYGVISPVHLNGKGDALDRGFADYSNLKSKEDLNDIKCKNDQIIPIHRVNAAFWMLSRETLKHMGGFSPVFHHYGEDMDYINRLHYHDCKIGYCPFVYGYHDRENRKPGKETLIFQLIEYANINRSFFKAFGYGVLAAFKKTFIALPKEGFNEFCRLFSISFNLLLKTFTIINARKMTKKSPEYLFIKP